MEEIIKALATANYQLLVELNIISTDGKLRKYSKLKSSGFMDLVLEPLPFMSLTTEKDAIFFSLAHQFKKNEDICQDPGLVLMAYPEKKRFTFIVFSKLFLPCFIKRLMRMAVNGNCLAINSTAF